MVARNVERIGRTKFSSIGTLAVASARLLEKSCNLRKITVIGLEDAVAAFCFFSWRGNLSWWAPKFAAVGTRVIDNSSAWRMDASTFDAEVNAGLCVLRIPIANLVLQYKWLLL